MIRMTDRARERLEEYLSLVRRALAPRAGVDADEVARDVRAHVEEALRDHPEPIGEDAVAGVLERLGSPGRWGPPEEAGGWRGALARIRTGPDDWRLAWLCFGLTALGFATLPLGVGALLVLPPFVLARGVVALADERGEPLGAKRWLTYPVLLLVYGLLGLALLAMPIAISPALFARGGLVDFLVGTFGLSYPAHGTSAHWVRSAAWTATGLGAWWLAFAGIAAARPRWVRAVFRPFGSGFTRRRAWSSLLLGFVLALLGTAALVFARPAAAQSLPEGRIRAIARSALGEVPGLVVAVGRGGEVLWTGAYGRASLEPDRPATPATRFRVYSVAKPWTAAAGLRLAAEGRLDPRAPISVPGFPDKGVPITAYELATHSAGIRHYRDGEAEMNRTCDTVREALPIFADDSLLFEPGTDRSYSTWGFVLLGAVLEQAAGEPFDAVLRREVLDPAGMTATVHAGPPRPGAARAYDRDGKGGYRDVTDATSPSCKWGGGGYLSTAADLARFPLAALSGTLLSPAGTHLILDEEEGTVNWTGGSGPGGTAEVRVDVESGLVVTAVANVGGALGTLRDVTDRIAAAVEATDSTP